MKRLFGTDGVRGRVGTELTADIAFKLGRAAAGYYLERGARRAILARDTRQSGEMLQSAVSAGLLSVGVEPVDLGIAPTPAVSMLLAAGECSPAFGVVISASHNPYEDNGLKFFAPDGRKLSVAEEEALERRFWMSAELDAQDRSVTRVVRDPDRVSRYLRLIREKLDVPAGVGDAGTWGVSDADPVGGPLIRNTRLVIDAANGAWSSHARDLFSGLCSTIEWIAADPDGTNINAGCGSTHIESLDRHLDASSIGLAFDGDGDRLLIRVLRPASRGIAAGRPVGHTIDGDAFLILFAMHTIQSGPVIGTVMSNGAVAAVLDSMGRPFERAPVGDREVFDLMEARAADLGGEQSGHMIFRRLAGGEEFQKTGDGAVTALVFLKLFAGKYGESIDALMADIPDPFPQKLVNLRVAEKRPWKNDPELVSAIESARIALGRHGRLVIRYSGTEPLLRIMAESPDAAAVEDQTAFLTDQFRRKLS